MFAREASGEVETLDIDLDVLCFPASPVGGSSSQGLRRMINYTAPSRDISLEDISSKPGIEDISRYLTTMWVQLLIRFVDFLYMNMVLPTLPEYVSHLGGTEYMYYACLVSQSVGMIIGNTVLGSYVDGGPGRMLPGYLATAAVIVAGSVLFIAAGTVPALRSPWTLVAARTMVGLGGSSNLLSSVFVAEVCSAEERPKWLIRNGMTRSQGLFWGPAIGMMLAAVAAPDPASPFGCNALPGCFQLASTLAVTGLLWCTWAEPPETRARADHADDVGDGARDSSFGDFLRQRRVRVLFLCIGFFGVCVLACEVVIPVVAKNALGQTGAASGWPLTAQACLLTVGQLACRKLTTDCFQDCTVCALGSFGISLTCGGAVLLWGLLDVHGGSDSPTLVVLGPFLLVAFFGPTVLLGGFVTFARLSLEDIPNHKGKLQALQNNIMSGCVALAPAWLAATYVGDRARREGVPRTCMALLGAVGTAVALLVLSQLGALRPRRQERFGSQLTGPLLD